ncbi:MAG: hypothetical protein JWQ09_3601 [Segetibacter sp.]|nr:hypothetical protein [Segetibacter sp.]
MLDEQKLNKLKELTKRAVSINEELLDEEKKFIDALSDYSDVTCLKDSSNKINLLMRKEVLYNQAARMLLNKPVSI